MNLSRAREVNAVAEAGGASAVFSWPQRVYYQHTDAGGMVFHANYLAFMENARTEMLQAADIDLGKLLRDDGVCFVVHSANIRFIKPGLLNDMLTTTARVEKVGGARMVFEQQVRRDDGDGELLVEATIVIACVDAKTYKLIPVPAAIREKFTDARTQAGK
jgi:acyl-CoA thioester hydrolase